MKKILIFKESSIKLDVYSDYIVVKKNSLESVFGFRYIAELYINKNIELSLKDSIVLAKNFKLFLIDRYGNILAEVKNYEKVWFFSVLWYSRW